MRLVGLLCWFVASASPWLWPSPAEKSGKFLALGHWWDRRVEVELPLVVVGCVLTLWGWRRALAAEERLRRHLVL